MPKSLAVIVALVAALALTGCGDTVADVHRDAKFKQACEAAGGKVWLQDFTGWKCDMTTGRN